jgi:hypothetical protein
VRVSLRAFALLRVTICVDVTNVEHNANATHCQLCQYFVASMLLAIVDTLCATSTP